MSSIDERPNLTITSGLSLPTPEAEERMPIRRSEWKRLRNAATHLEHPVPGLTQWVAFFLGVAIAAVMACVPWQAAYDGQTGWAWVSPTLIVTAVASVILAVILGITAHRLRKELKSRIVLFCEDMDEIEKHHPYEGPPKVASAQESFDGRSTAFRTLQA